MPVSVEPKELLRILHSESGVNTLIRLRSTARRRRVIVKEYLLDPVTQQLLHADFYRVDLDKPLTVKVPVVLHGRAEGRQAAGRRARLRAPRNRGRVPAGEIPEHIDDRRQRAG